MATTPPSIGDTFAGIGDAAHDLFSGIGNFEAAGSDQISARYARQNADLEAESLGIKQAQLGRQLYDAIGGQKADVASAGFAASGSALDLLRDASAQGALAKNQLQVQGQVAINQYRGQADAADASASAEQTAGIGAFIGTALSTVATVLPFLLL